MNLLKCTLVAAMSIAAVTSTPTTRAQDGGAPPSEHVVRQYLSAWNARDVEGLLKTLAPDAVVIIPSQAPIVGHEHIRPLLKHFVDEFSQKGSTFRFEDLQAQGQVVSFRWSGDTPTTTYLYGSNTYVIRNGRIAYLTVALQAIPKSNGDGHATHDVVAADKIAWTAGPAVLPTGTQVAVLAGDPAKPGLFVMRAKLPDGAHVAPHWHSSAEHVTVLQGTFRVGMGPIDDDAASTAVRTGGFFVAPAKMVHYGRAEGETVLEVSGLGPFDLNYVNEPDRVSQLTSGR